MAKDEHLEPRPAGYPFTDTAEVQAITILEGKINAKFVKADLQKRDKVPNSDGTLTLVDDKGVPTGKFEVQVKAIQSGKTSFSCTSQLVGFSAASLAPVLLICVDIGKKLVYWKHIYREMPEFKINQKTFTVHFDEKVDLIDDFHQYIHTWNVILIRYQTLFRGAQILRTEILKELSLSGLPTELVIAFQIYIDTINSSLDTEFKILKPILFPNIWKFGVAVFSYDSETVTFREFAIERGNNGPLLVYVPNGLKVNAGIKETAVETHLTRFSVNVQDGALETKTLNRDSFLLPELKAKEFLYQVYLTGRSNRFFKLGGTMLYVETIFAFVEKFSFAMGIEKFETLALDELRLALTVTLPAWYDVALERYGFNFQSKSAEIIPTLEGLVTGSYSKIYDIRTEEVREKIESGKVDSYSCLFFNDLHLRQAVEGVEVLLTRGYKTIEKPYFSYEKFPLLTDGTPENDEKLKCNLNLITSNLNSEYNSFISENFLCKLFLSKRMQNDLKYLFYVDLEEWHAEPTRPHLYECQILDSKGILPKFSLFFGQPNLKRQNNVLVVQINGEDYATRHPFHKDVREIIDERPLQEWIINDFLRFDGEVYNAAYDYLRLRSQQLDQ